jgi:hypothetical protein
VEGIYRLRQQIRQYQIGMKLSKQKKTVNASDKVVCGNVIAEYNDNIIIKHGEFVSHQLMIPKSKVDSCDGKELHLNIPYSMLSRFDL